MRWSAIVFDVGGVLLDWDPRHLYRKVFTDPNEMEWFLANVCDSEWNAQQDVGRPFADAVSDLALAHPRYDTAIRAYWARWSEMVPEEVEGMAPILDALKRRGLALYGLTNWSAETFPVVQDRFALLDRLDGIVISGVEGVAKPDPSAFDRLVQRYDLSPPSTLFIDDNPENVQAADALGYDTHLFTSADDLLEVLREGGALD